MSFVPYTWKCLNFYLIYAHMQFHVLGYWDKKKEEPQKARVVNLSNNYSSIFGGAGSTETFLLPSEQESMCLLYCFASWVSCSWSKS